MLINSASSCLLFNYADLARPDVKLADWMWMMACDKNAIVSRMRS